MLHKEILMKVPQTASKILDLLPWISLDILYAWDFLQHFMILVILFIFKRFITFVVIFMIFLSTFPIITFCEINPVKFLHSFLGSMQMSLNCQNNQQKCPNLSFFILKLLQRTPICKFLPAIKYNLILYLFGVSILVFRSRTWKSGK